MKTIKSVIVEDELSARETLKSYLSKYCPQIEVIGEAHNAKEVNFVKSYHKNSGGYVVLEDNTEIEISASYKDDFLQLFK